MTSFLHRVRFPPWAQVAALTALALGLRLAYVLQVKDTSLVAPEELDPALYYNWGRTIAAGDWLGKDPFVQSPLYAYFLGALMSVLGTSVPRLLVVQAILGCVTVVLTYVAARRFFGHRRGLVAGLIVALYGPFIFYEGMVMKTFLAPLLTILLVLLLDRAREAATEGAPSRRSALLFAGAGVAYGLTTLDRDNFILLAPVLAALAVVIGGGLNRRGLRHAALFTLGTVLMIAPVTLRNWAVSREFVLLTTGGGEVFFIGNNPDANGLYVPPPFVRPDPRYEHADFIARASEIEGRALTPMQSSWFWFRQGLSFIVEEPLAWARLIWLKFTHFWNFFELPDNLDYQIMQRFSPLLATLNGAFPPAGVPTLAVPVGEGRAAHIRLHLLFTFGTVAPLGLFGVWLLRRHWRPLLPLYVLLFGYMATVLLFFNFSRFRVPVVPILALFATAALAALGTALHRLWAAAVALAARAGDLPARLRALNPGVAGTAAAVLFALVVAWVNVERPRGVVPAIEQALVAGNAYYADERWDEALQQYMTGLLLLGEGPEGAGGDRLLARFGPGVTREALRRELEVESVARGPQFTGMHLGIHHGIGIALVQQADALLRQGNRRHALPLLDQAIAQFDEALRIAPAYALSLRKMARAHALKGDQAAATEWLRKAVDLWPEDVQARFELAEALYDTRAFREALQQIDAADHYDKSGEPRVKALIHLHRGLVFQHGLSEPGRALFHFEQALLADPEVPQAAEVRAAILDIRARGFQPLADDLFRKEPRETLPP